MSLCAESAPTGRPRRGGRWALVAISAALAVGNVRALDASMTELKKLSIEQLMEIEVTSVSRSAVELKDAPSALQVITAEDIRRSGATSLPEALRLTNNLNVAQKTAGTWGISARGFNTELANKLLVMIDGRTVYTPLFSGVRWDVQDYLLEDLDRIEVISGPGGSVWGANAVNGVINITSRNARDTQGFYAEAAGGTQLRQAYAARYGGALGPHTHFRLYGKYAERGDERFASGAEAGDGAWLSQTGFRLDHALPTDGLVTVQGDYYQGRIEAPGAGVSKTAGGNLLSRWTQVLANGSEAQLQVYYDRAFVRQANPPSLFGPGGNFTDDLETYDIDFQHSVRAAANHAIVWGLGYRLWQDETKDAPTLGFAPRDLKQELFSGFVQDQFPLGRAVLVTLGTKLEHNDYTGFEIEPSVRGQAALSEDDMVWAAVSRAVRTPSRIDRDIRQPSRGTTILSGGANFSSETVVAYEAGYRARLGRRLVGSAAFFYNDYRNIRSLSLTPVTLLPLFFGNDVEGNTRGVEVSASYDVLSWWRLQGGYTLLKSALRVRAGGQDLNNALNETADPETQVMLSSSMDLPGHVELDAQLRWVDTLIVNNAGTPATVPSYLDLNVRIGVRLSDQLELSVIGQNLLDEQHPEFGVPGPGRIEIRRNVMAKMTWRY